MIAVLSWSAGSTQAYSRTVWSIPGEGPVFESSGHLGTCGGIYGLQVVECHSAVEYPLTQAYPVMVPPGSPSTWEGERR